MKMSKFEAPVRATLQGDGVLIGTPMTFVRMWGCDYSCSFCFVPDTPILMSDWSYKPLGDLRVGDYVVGVETKESGRKGLFPVEVTRLSRSFKKTARVGELRCTPDHKFWKTRQQKDGELAHDGWTEAQRAEGQRVLFLTRPPPFDFGEEYHRGYLAGMADGDGCFWTLKKDAYEYRRFRLALTNTPELLYAYHQRALQAGFTLRPGVHAYTGFKSAPETTPCLWLTVDQEARRFEAWLGRDGKLAFWYGYLGGVFDAEGSLAEQGQLRISQDSEANPETYARIRKALDACNFSYSEEAKGFYISRDNGELWRFLAWARPLKLSSLGNAWGDAIANARTLPSVVPTGIAEEVITVTTECGSFVAGGYLVKNCDTKDSWREGRANPRAARLSLSPKTRVCAENDHVWEPRSVYSKLQVTRR